jgi:hypothetical protein
MNTRILNRAGKLPEDGFYQIEALGEHVNHAARVVQVIDAQAVDSIVNRFASEATKAGEEFPGMRIDKDHLSQSMANPTESLGWMMAIRNRDGIPEAKIDWTAMGLPLIESKPGQPPVYKFFSTEYDPNQCQKIGTRIINRKSYDVVRPLRLDGLSLTNDPNNKGQRPISNRDGKTAGAAEENQPKSTMNRLFKALGLADDASEDSAVAALQTIQNRATTAEGLVTALTTERDALLTVQVEADLEKYKGVIKNRDVVKTQLIANRKGTIELLESLDTSPEKEAPARVTNRAAAKPPAAAAGAATEEEDARRARKISNRATELKAAGPARSFDSCWTQAQQEEADKDPQS